jgi:putative membrane protein
MYGTAIPATLALLHADGDFSWGRFVVHLDVLIGCLALVGGYLYAIGPLRRRLGITQTVDTLRVSFFVGAIAVIFLALNGPIHDLSDYYLFSAHMVQHILLMMLMPPLLLAGIPHWLFRWLAQPRPVMATARVLTKPLVAYALYNAVLIGWHFPGMYNWALESHAVHIVQHLMFMVVSVLMWWPVVNPLPELNKLQGPLQLLYLFAFGIPMSILSAMITFSERVLYPWYDAAPRIFSITALEDQQIGGLIMWVPGGILFWIAITLVFFRWSREERRREEQERALARA